MFINSSTYSRYRHEVFGNTKNNIMLRAQVNNMLNMDDAALKRYIQKECKHKDEILACISTLRNEALERKEEHRFNQLCWLYNIVKGVEVLCP